MRKPKRREKKGKVGKGNKRKERACRAFVPSFRRSEIEKRGKEKGVGRVEVRQVETLFLGEGQKRNRGRGGKR